MREFLEYEKVNSVISSMHEVLTYHPDLERIFNKEIDTYEFKWVKDGKLFLQWGKWDSDNNFDDPDRYFLIFDEKGESQKFFFRDWYNLNVEEIKQKVHALMGNKYTIKTNPDFIKEIQDKVETKTYNELDYNDFDKLVELIYGHSFEFIADQESGNDSNHNFSIKDELTSYEKDDLTKFKETGAYNYLAHILLNDLVIEGILPKGEWMITVCW